MSARDERSAAEAGEAQEAPSGGAPPVGVLLMAYGGPNSLEELPGYLADIRSGRVTTPSVLAEMQDHYGRIGGRSPLLGITEKQVAALAARLGEGHYRCYLGMRHWRPWLEETVGGMIEDGIERAVSLVLAPHYSSMSIARYQRKIDEALQMYRGSIEFRHIESYHRAPGLIAALAARVREGIERFPEEERGAVHIVFSAHSLPARIIRDGDPYEEQLKETARLVAEEAGIGPDRWSWSYQSAGKSSEPWLGPQLEDYLPSLAAKGVRGVVSVPVGFVADHVELLYDIDIEARAAADRAGIRLERPPALNDDPLFIEALAALVRERSADWVEEGG